MFTKIGLPVQLDQVPQPQIRICWIYIIGL